MTYSRQFAFIRGSSSSFRDFRMFRGSHFLIAASGRAGYSVVPLPVLHPIHAVMPPSITNTCPVTYEASSDARYNAA
jgi:hypothetical protein